MQIKRTMDLKTGDAKLFTNGVAHNQEAARPARETHQVYKALLSFSLERARKRLRGRRRALIKFANWRRLNHFRSSGASIRRKRRANSLFFEMVCWFFLIWICSRVPLKGGGSRYLRDGGVQV
jgi:hypothetical protein